MDTATQTLVCKGMMTLRLNGLRSLHGAQKSKVYPHVYRVLARRVGAEQLHTVGSTRIHLFFIHGASHGRSPAPAHRVARSIGVGELHFYFLRAPASLVEHSLLIWAPINLLYCSSTAWRADQEPHHPQRPAGLNTQAQA